MKYARSFFSFTMVIRKRFFFAGRVREKIMSQNNLAPYFGFIILNDYLASSRGFTAFTKCFVSLVSRVVGA